MFLLAHDFNFVGGFQAYWTELFTLCKEHRPDFGERPNKATFDPDADHKIRHNANPPFTPYELTKKGYDDCMLLFAHYTCVDYMLRGAIEVSKILKYFFNLSIRRVLTFYCFFQFEPSNLSRAHFVLGEKKDGEYKGRECLKLLNHVTEKKKKLSLQDYLCRKDNGQFDMVDFIQDNFSIVKLYKHIEKHHMPAEETGIEVG